MAATFVVVAGAFLLVNNATESIAGALRDASADVAALFVGGAAAAILGALDDLLDLRARWQFLGQFVLAVGAPSSSGSGSTSSTTRSDRAICSRSPGRSRSASRSSGSSA